MAITIFGLKMVIANKPKSIIMIKEIIRLKSPGYSHKKFQDLLNMSRTTVIKYAKRIEATGIALEELLLKDEAELDELFTNKPCQDSEQRFAIAEDYFKNAEKELQRTRVTRFILWAE